LTTTKGFDEYVKEKKTPEEFPCAAAFCKLYPVNIAFIQLNSSGVNLLESMFTETSAFCLQAIAELVAGATLGLQVGLGVGVCPWTMVVMTIIKIKKAVKVFRIVLENDVIIVRILLDFGI
jgi:hypothetical protein